MRKSFATIAFALIVATSSTVLFAQQSLFSDVRVDSVFSPGSSNQTPAPATPRISPAPHKLTDAGQLSRLLREAGFEPKEVGSQVVSTKTESGELTFPLLATISDDQSQLVIVLMLGTVEDEKQIPADKLLALMDANRKYAPSYFAYSSKRRRTELYHVMQNQAVTSKLLDEQISRLAEIALQTENLWKIEPSLAEQPQDQPQDDAQPQAPTTPAAPSISLAGTWSAVRSAKEAFAIQFDASGTFNLVYVNQGKQSKSTGKFTLNGQSLTLEGKGGFRLQGTIKSKSDKEFQLSFEKNSLTFKKA